MKEGYRVMLISVPECMPEDLYKCGVIKKIKDNTPNGRNIDIILDGEDGVSAVFDHQLMMI